MLVLLTMPTGLLFAMARGESPNCAEVLVLFARGSGQNDPSPFVDEQDDSLTALYSRGGVERKERETATFLNLFIQT